MTPRQRAPRPVVTCEHASRAVPRAWRDVLAVGDVHRAGHAAFDAGAGPVARRLAAAVGAPCVLGAATRLLVDLNRSEDHPRLHGPAVRAQPAGRRRALVADLWRPFRAEVEALVAARATDAPVLHLSVHSFVPVLDGRPRVTDAALLFDPGRPAEARLARAWLDRWRAELPGLALHANRPYRGTSDGHTTALRRRFPDAAYAGLELELNQRHRGTRTWRRLVEAVERALVDTVAGG